MRNDRQQRPDYYRILGISPDATPGEVREAYRQAAKRWHPDLNPSAEAAARMREVNEAWRVLGDEAIRAGYDRARRNAETSGAGDAQSREVGTREPGGGGRFNSPAIFVGLVVLAALLGALSMLAISTFLEGEPEVVVVNRDVTRVVTRDVTRVVPRDVTRLVTRVATRVVNRDVTRLVTRVATRIVPRDVTRVVNRDVTRVVTRVVARAARPTPRVSPTPIWGNYQGSDYDLVLDQDVDDDHINCPVDGIVDRSFYQGKVEFYFVVPDAPVWSVGVVYHNHWEASHDSASIIAKKSDGRIGVDHWTRTEWEEISRPPFKEVSVSQYGIYPGNRVRFGLVTNGEGSRLYVDGREVMSIPTHELRPVASVLRICAGFYSGEPRDYSVEIERYRAGWTRSAAESTAIAR